MFLSCADVRIDFAGGWTDIPMWREQEVGAVLNATISVSTYAYVDFCYENKQVSFCGYPIVEQVESQCVRIHSADFNVYEEAKSISELEYNGRVDLVKAAIRRMLPIEKGVQIETRSDAPAGSGLGTSAALAVALVGGLSELSCLDLDQREIAEEAVRLEIEELKLFSGKQDHYASAFGGFNYLMFDSSNVRVIPVRVAPDILLELEKHSLLVYTGSRLSSSIHEHVVNGLGSQHAPIMNAFRAMSKLAQSARNALVNGELKLFGRLVSENWSWQKGIHPISNEQVDRLHDEISDLIYGFKLCGAGGGGCAYVLTRAGKEREVREVVESFGFQVIPFRFSFDGLRTIHSHLI